MSGDTLGGQCGNQHGPARDALRELDGVEQIALLPQARTVALAPSPPDSDEPTYVVIIRSPTVVECPCPGSPIWRAVLEQCVLNHWIHAAVAPRDTGSDPVHAAIAADLQRFPSLDAWIHWRDHDRIVPERPR